MRTILFTSLIAVAACATTANDDQLDDQTTGKADAASKPSGSYTNATPHIGELETLTLAADKTFVRTELVECASNVFDCPPIEQRGTYAFTHSSTDHFIRFYGSDGSTMDRYQWNITDGHLELSADGDAWFEMNKASKSCGGFFGARCDNGEYCDYPDDSCGAADRPGVCQPIPSACPALEAPVCGCDGHTYSNTCEAHAHGVDPGHDGICAIN